MGGVGSRGFVRGRDRLWWKGELEGWRLRRGEERGGVTVFVAEHEHIQSSCCGMVEEVDGGVRFVVMGRH